MDATTHEIGSAPGWELRVLTGLQAGARMPLAQGRYLLGGSVEHDVVLAAPGIDATALSLDVDAGSIQLTPMQPGVGLAERDSRTQPFRLEVGVAFHVAGTWIVIDDPESPWPQPGSWHPAPRELEPDTDLRADPPDDLYATDSQRSFRIARFGWAGLAAAVIGVVMSAGVVLGPALWDRLPFRSAQAKVLEAAGMVMSTATATAKAAVSTATAVATPASTATTHTAVPAPVVAASRPVNAPRPLTAGEAWVLLSRDVTPAEPAPVYSTYTGPAEVTITDEMRRAWSVPDEPASNADSGQDTSMAPASHAGSLPFAVRQIACGSQPSIYTADGVKIFEGGAYKGYRLLRISGNSLRLSGASQVDLRC